jgi:hypothetical protein
LGCVRMWKEAVCGLMCNAFSTSDSIAWNGKRAKGCGIRKDLEKHGCDLFQGTMTEFGWRD